MYFPIYHSLIVLQFKAIFSVAQRPNSGLGRLTDEVSSAHTDRHAQPVGLLCTTDQLVAEVLPTQHTKKKTKETNVHAVSGIQTRDLSNRAASDLCVRPHGHRDRLPSHMVLAIDID
jgi:hypothetical protein